MRKGRGRIRWTFYLGSRPLQKGKVNGDRVRFGDGKDRVRRVDGRSIGETKVRPNCGLGKGGSDVSLKILYS